MTRSSTMRNVLAGTAALLLAGGLAAGPVQAAPVPSAGITHAPVQVRAGTPAAERVLTFFEEYRAAVLGESGEDPRAVREAYLSAHLNYRLDAWAAQHDADPVFRAQNVPGEWRVHQEDEQYGFASVRLTEAWGGAASQDVWYTVRLTDRKIVELNDRPAF
ncbi:hypothetical protein ACIRBX_23800 [Kitasatospora sp. NPDC096147]|uniref:hypothetical protein n=1 Tax=Kitasatospora sp. NPDC096147 TaxID=3364093 RepID=UPI003828DD8C